MTVDERFEQLERKTQRLEKRNKRLTVGLTMTVVAMCAMVTMAATGLKDGEFDTVVADTVAARTIKVGSIHVIHSYDMNSAATHTAGLFLFADEDGGMIVVNNKTRQNIVAITSDDYGNGYVEVLDRKGRGRMYR